jgi:hypothetical protein
VDTLGRANVLFISFILRFVLRKLFLCSNNMKYIYSTCAGSITPRPPWSSLTNHYPRNEKDREQGGGAKERPLRPLHTDINPCFKHECTPTAREVRLICLYELRRPNLVADVRSQMSLI